MIVCEADLGLGRAKGEVVKKNDSTIIMKLLNMNKKINMPEVSLIKRHIVKHHVVTYDTGRA